MFEIKHSQDVSDDPDRPAVHSFTVGFLSQNLRSWNKKDYTTVLDMNVNA